METTIKLLQEKVKKLQAFKDYVHQRLDEAGIEKEPNGEHSKSGCRIGDRLDLVLNDDYEYMSEEKRTEHNTNVVAQFMHHCQEDGLAIPDRYFESFFNA